MSRPTSAVIHLDAIRDNYLQAKRAAPEARAWAVVKANAYGHGLLRCAQALKHAEGFALLSTEDAIQLRQAGLTQPILLLEGVFGVDDLRVAARHSCSIVVHCEEQLQMLECSSVPTQIDIFLKINTGMNRLGFRPEYCKSALQRLQQCRAVREIVLMTHFAQADEEGISDQLASFQTIVQNLPFKHCLANSATILRYPAAHAQIVRPGLMLYGASPMPQIASAASLGLKPVMTLSSQILAIQNIKKGEKVGYGGTFTAEKPMSIGIVACGYADGYPRHADTGTPVLVEGQRTTTVGRVSMDMLACDLTHLPHAHVGSPVVLWGQNLPVDEIAACAGTISYELLSAIAPRVPLLTA